MVTNLLGRRVVIADDDPTLADWCCGKAGFVVAVGDDDEAFWLLVEIANSGRLATVKARDCTLSPA